MQVLQNVQLLNCLNKKGELKINEVLKEIVNDSEYLKKSSEQVPLTIDEQDKLVERYQNAIINMVSLTSDKKALSQIYTLTKVWYTSV